MAPLGAAVVAVPLFRRLGPGCGRATPLTAQTAAATQAAQE